MNDIAADAIFGEGYLIKKLGEDKSSAGRVGAQRRIEAKRVAGRPARILGFDTT